MTIKNDMNFDHAYLAKLESGREPLPVGVHKTSRGKGYRIARTFKGKEYRFGTFQSLEHALRTNEFINRFLIAVNEEVSKRGATVEDVEQIVDERTEVSIEAINQTDISIKVQTEIMKFHLDRLNQINEKPSLWKRLFG